jgi:ribonuclease HII
VSISRWPVSLAAEEKARLLSLYRYEAGLWSQGFDRVAGVDEAGLGTLAGPVVAAAVVLPRLCLIEGVNDSKVLDEAERDRLAGEIRHHALAVGVGVVSVEEIAALHIYRAGLLAMERAVNALDPQPDVLLIDGDRRLGCRRSGRPLPQKPLVRGDSVSANIASASIIAKTHRDTLMRELDKLHPEYGFAVHKGYGTELHLEQLRALGPSPAHRAGFRPVRERLRSTPVQGNLGF